MVFFLFSKRGILCGIPWHHLCQPFVRTVLIHGMHRYRMRDNAQSHDYLRHFTQQLVPSLRSFLFLLSMTSGRIQASTVQSIRQVKTLPHALFLLGFFPMHFTDKEAHHETLQVIDWALSIVKADAAKFVFSLIVLLICLLQAHPPRPRPSRRRSARKTPQRSPPFHSSSVHRGL